MLAAAGLDMILMNAMDAATMRTAEACRNLTAGGIFTWQ
jgi:hypothetical protein